ncbi:carbon storage regulator [Pseudomonas endophytica]|uniref:Carbon storage regulator n=1 Tax=Pseudomonas endophytica TaxID=1563157 RepID=A0A0Q0XV89_9PSED|nr:carbon storage regulator CsrA [Pseudomonas endophytica]KQB54512.1 carbon storage regulator [Pseudomonas endophytica]
MQKLKRIIGEHFLIGEDIVVHVIDVKGSHVRLGIDAPESVSVHRAEIYQRIKKQSLGYLPLDPTRRP